MISSRIPIAVLSLAALALIVAGCGGSSSGPSYSTSSTTASGGEGSGGAQAISAAEVPELGTVLVDSEGFTVYRFAKDKGSTSSCYGACAENWPPVTASGKPTAGEGAMSSELGTSRRKDGTMQVTYAGHPLYTYVNDTSPGEASGNGLSFFGGEWNALEEGGAPVAASAGGEGGSSAPAESSGGSGRSYGY